MQVIPQEISACVSAMSIENGKEGALGPSLTLLLRWFLNIEDNANSVFIIISDYPLVRISCIAFDYSVLFDRVFGTFKVRQLYMRHLPG